uniref:Uncharacterized protein n=1 Tax=Arundo donax TaxID=35708 RepID=A0A0A9F2N1_ARUDO
MYYPRYEMGQLYRQSFRARKWLFTFTLELRIHWNLIPIPQDCSICIPFPWIYIILEAARGVAKFKYVLRTIR